MRGIILAIFVDTKKGGTFNAERVFLSTYWIILLQLEDHDSIMKRLFSLAFKESNLDSITNLMNMDYHIVLKLSKIFEEYREAVDKEMEEKKKEVKKKSSSKKPRKR